MTDHEKAERDLNSTNPNARIHALMWRVAEARAAGKSDKDVVAQVKADFAKIRRDTGKRF